MKNKIIVRKIIDYTEKILGYAGEYNYEQFAENPILVEACVFNLGQMGELANRIDRDFEETHGDIPWRTLYGLRNKIVHDYEGVKQVLIWQIISNDLPVLKKQLEELYNSL